MRYGTNGQLLQNEKQMPFLILILVALVIFYFYAKSWSARNAQNFELIHDAAKESLATDEPVTVAAGTTAAASKFFEVYGTTEKKFESMLTPVVLYAGYVRLGGEEVVAVAVRNNGGITVMTHPLPYSFGQDMLSLIGKSQYIKDIMQKYKAASGRV
ncbi:subtilase family serine protease [Paraburkholderia sp. RAU6.4a]|uniref:hypothetical protein n=1 Tax=Paraburkholderia sp. RAU6.4a TaxID=2991067 RepID=UPI003D1CD492